MNWERFSNLGLIAGYAFMGAMVVKYNVHPVLIIAGCLWLWWLTWEGRK